MMESDTARSSRKLRKERAVVTELLVLPDGTEPVSIGSGQVVSLLGEGGAALVYEIWNDKLGISRALKLMRPNATEAASRRFETEMRLLARLQHPNIVKIHDVGEWNGLPFFEMDRIEGPSLRALIEERGALPAPVCIAAGIMLCRALSFMHDCIYETEDRSYRGILHRDLKPTNILMDRDGCLYLTDFGIAIPADLSGKGSEGEFVGSMQYTAPEQIDGLPLDRRSDLFSVGCILYEMLTGHRAFPQKNMTQLVAERIENHYRPLQSYDIHIPRGLIRLTDRCLELVAERRPESAAMLLSMLEKQHALHSVDSPEEVLAEYLNRRDTSAVRSIARRKRRWQPGALIAAAAIIAAALFAGYEGESTRTREAQREGNRADLETRHGSSPITENESSNTRSANRQEESSEGANADSHRQESEPQSPTEQSRNPSPPSSETPQRDVPGERRAGGDEAVAEAAIEKQYRQHHSGGENPDEIVHRIAQLLKEHNYGDALSMLEQLPRSRRNAPEVQLYHMRALIGTANAPDLAEFFDSHSIHDREFYVGKAVHLFEQDRYREAARQLEKALAAPTLMADPESLERAAHYYLALSVTGLAEGSDEPSAIQEALNGWFRVKYAYRNHQDHPFFAAANRYIRHLSDRLHAAR